MNLSQRLDQDLKEAMRNRDALRRDSIRMARAAIHNEEIAQGQQLSDEGILDVLTRQAKRHRESIDMFTQANRTDLVSREEAELKVLRDYLPQQLSEIELRQFIEQAIKEVSAEGPRDIGKVMKELVPKIKGRADGKAASAVVQEILASNS